VYSKAVPVMLTKSEEFEQSMTAPAAEAIELKRPFADT
jgi:hypothetical protein